MSKWIIPFSFNNQGDRIFSDWVISLKMDFYVFAPGILEFFLQHLRKVYFHITKHWAKGFQIFIQYKMFFLTPHSFLKPHLLTIFTSHRLPQSSGQWSFLFHAALACSCRLGPSPISDEYLLVFVFFLLYPMSSPVSPIFKTRFSSSPFSSFLQGQLFHSSLGCPVHACFLVIDLLPGKTRLDPFVCFHVPLRRAGEKSTECHAQSHREETAKGLSWEPCQPLLNPNFLTYFVGPERANLLEHVLNILHLSLPPCCVSGAPSSRASEFSESYLSMDRLLQTRLCGSGWAETRGASSLFTPTLY